MSNQQRHKNDNTNVDKKGPNQDLNKANQKREKSMYVLIHASNIQKKSIITTFDEKMQNKPAEDHTNNAQYRDK